jgi:hypothetical protein
MTPYKFGSTFYTPPPPPAAVTTTPTDGSGAAPQQMKRSPPFTIKLPTFTSSAAAFADGWEYDEDEDDMVEREHADLVDDRRHTSTSSKSAPG